jgi:hypothetical protein
MSTIGKTVYKAWATNALRFGIVDGEKIEAGWLYVHVNWKDDEAYIMDTKRVAELRNQTYNPPQWHRIDSVRVFDAYGMIGTLEKLRHGNSF